MNIEQLYEENKFVIEAKCFQYFHWDEDLASSAQSETWILAVRFFDTFKGESKASTWLYRVCINACKNLSKKINSTKRRQDLYNPYYFKEVDEPCHFDTPELMLEMEQESEQIDKDIKNASPTIRDPFLLSCWEVMNYKELSNYYFIPLGSMKSRINRAKIKLHRNAPAYCFSRKASPHLLSDYRKSDYRNQGAPNFMLSWG